MRDFVFLFILTVPSFLLATVDLSAGSGVTTILLGGHNLSRAFVPLATSKTIVLKVAPDTPLTLELEELNGRDNDTRAYLITVDGVARWLRTYQPQGAGPVHFFLPLAKTSRSTLSLTLTPLSHTPPTIARIWVHADLHSSIVNQHLDTPFRIAPLVHLTWTDQAKDLQKLSLIASAFTGPNALPAWTCTIAYAKWDDPTLHSRIDYALSLARQSHLPLQLDLDSWWSSTPGPPWQGREYQQIIWDATDKTYKLSIPNQWANTPWLTLNNPALNNFKLARLKAATEYIASHTHGELLSINLDNEPIYWASGNAGLGSHLLYADFNPTTIAAAKADGITLDPADGLSTPERHWLANNLLHYQTLLADTVTQSLGRQAKSVDGDPLADNVYTQAYVSSAHLEYPMLDPSWPVWETGAPLSARVGGEWNSDSPVERSKVLHQLPLGRTANTNAECENRPIHAEGARMAYALGLQYFTPYNYPLNQLSLLAKSLADPNEPLGSLEYREPLPAPTPQRNNVTQSLLSNTATIATRPTSAAHPGILQYTLPPQDGLYCEIYGRAINSTLRLYAGDSESTLKLLHTYKDLDPIDLRHAVRLPASPHLIVRLELDATALSSDLQDWVALYDIRFTKPWPAFNLPAITQTLTDSREQNLLVTWRAEAERALAAHSTPSAQAAYDRGEYRNAYFLAHP